jgi:DNA-binding transcriptional MerR regulator
MQANRQLMRSGELASRAGVSTDTLRYYEQKGVLSPPPRSSNGYRCYPAESLERVQMVRSALRIGFSIGELAHVLRIRQGGGVPCRSVRAMASAKLRELRQRQVEVARLCRLLKTVIRRWDRQLGRTAPGERAHLLDTLTDGDSPLMARLASPSSSGMGRKLRRGAPK